MRQRRAAALPVSTGRPSGGSIASVLGLPLAAWIGQTHIGQAAGAVSGDWLIAQGGFDALPGSGWPGSPRRWHWASRPVAARSCSDDR